MKYEDAEIFTFFFTLVFIQLNIFSLMSVLGIFWHKRTVLFSNYDQPTFFITLCVINYLIAFRKVRYLTYENEKLSGLSTFAVIILSYTIFGVAAYSYKAYFFHRS